MPNGEPPCLRSELGCFGSDMGEKVDFHLLLEDKEEEDEASLPVLLPLLLPDFLPLSLSPSLLGPSLLSKDIVAIFLSILELELSAGYPESSSSELGAEEYRPVPLSSRGRSLFKMGGWSRSGPLGLRLDCSGEEIAEISRGWLMLFTMELMFSGDPEEWLLELSPGNDLLFGDPLAVTAPVELRFLLPRFRPS